MIITPQGKQFLNPQELQLLSLDKLSHIYHAQVFPLSSECNVNRFGRIVIKASKPIFNRHEVQLNLLLSQLSPIFPPVLAYGDDFFVAPYIDGMSLFDSGVNHDFINSMSYCIAEVLLKVGIFPHDIHNENVIITPTSFHVIDLEQYKPMDSYNLMNLPQLANYIFEELTQNE